MPPHDQAQESNVPGTRKQWELKYEVMEKIGQGVYGQVYKARDRRSNSVVAIKKMTVWEEGEGLQQTTIREVDALKKLSHPCIVRLLNVELALPSMYLIFEFMDKDLDLYLRERRRLNETLPQDLIRSYMFQLTTGLAYCHKNCIVHRDLKSANVLIDSQGNLKLADFGLSRPLAARAQQYSQEVVTLYWRGPELLLGASTYGSELDVWSLGCIFSELCSLSPPFQGGPEGGSEVSLLIKIFQTLGTPRDPTVLTGPDAPGDRDNVWPGVGLLPFYNAEFPHWPRPARGLELLAPGLGSDGLDLLSKMLVCDPKYRISCPWALKTHPYFSGMGERDLPPSTHMAR